MDGFCVSLASKHFHSISPTSAQTNMDPQTLGSLTVSAWENSPSVELRPGCASEPAVDELQSLLAPCLKQQKTEKQVRGRKRLLNSEAAEGVIYRYICSAGWTR